MATPSPPLGDPVPDSQPAALPRREPLEGRWVSLRPVDPESDVDELFTIGAGGPERDAIWTYLHSGPFADRDAMLAWLRECAAADDRLALVVHDHRSGRRVGMASFLRIRPAMRVLEVGSIWYGLRAQRTHVNTATILLMLEAAFDRLGYRRVEWKCDALNERSRAAALRLGFAFEGVFRQHMIIRGRNRDTAWYALLDGDWPAVRQRLEDRLAAT